MANAITLSRLPLLALVVALFYLAAPAGQAAALVLLVLLLVLDWVDGMVARRLGETSLLGSVLDIASDRTVEVVLWVVFAHLGLIPIWIPLLILPRGVLTDSLRGVMVAEGVEPFKATTSRLAQLLIQSRASRGAYGVSKFVAFTLLGLELVLRAYAPAEPWISADVLGWVHRLAIAASLVAFAFCWIRAVPVLAEAWRWGQQGRPARPEAAEAPRDAS